MKPIIELKYKTIQIAVFSNEYEGKTFYSVSINRSYKDKKGEWQKQTINVNQDQLLELSTLLERTFWEIADFNAKKLKKSKAEEGTNDQKQKENVFTNNVPENAKITDLDNLLSDIPFNEDR